MRIGIQLPEVERVVHRPEYLSMARAAEEAGFDSLWLGDHLLYDEPDRGPWEVWTQIAALAAATERVTIGPLVACVGFHPPGLIAKMAATIDEISQGRFILGVGAGWNRREFDAFGIPYDKRVSRFEEAFAIIRGMLDGERVTLAGEFHRADDLLLLPPPRRRIPIVIGSNGPRMLGIAAPHAQVWNTWWADYGNTPEGFAALQARIPPQLERSACMLVQFPGEAVERAPEAPPVAPGDAADHIRALGEAGADEVIVVASPMTEKTIRALGDRLGDLLL
jgi:alkanesulfonate monooxygenase SsuD/methylene tetrahydromethanopterin reductase-like flavin-dependent oxidoreductase (luciferase family)